MKRERSEYEESVRHLDIAKCLMLLSQTFATKSFSGNQSAKEDANHFECKTCNRRFSSFQALGGHRASHKRPKLAGEQQQQQQKHNNMANNDKHAHECSICGQSFGTGQALGGHMRRHRASPVVTATGSAEQRILSPPVPTAIPLPVLKRCNSSKRVFSLDLNLTPLENDLEYVFGKALAPKIDMNFVS